MECLVDLSFGDFEVPPLDIPPPLSSKPSAECLPVEDSGSSQPHSQSAEYAEHSTPRDVLQQEQISSSGTLNPGNGHMEPEEFTSRSVYSRSTPENQTVLAQSLWPPRSPQSAITPPAKTNAAAERHLTSDHTPAFSAQTNGPSRNISVTLDGRNFYSISISQLQTAREVRAAISGCLGMSPDTHIFIYLVTAAGRPYGKALTDGALQEEVICYHKHTDNARLFIFRGEHRDSGNGYQVEHHMPRTEDSLINGAINSTARRDLLSGLDARGSDTSTGRYTDAAIVAALTAREDQVLVNQLMVKKRSVSRPQGIPPLRTLNIPQLQGRPTRTRSPPSISRIHSTASFASGLSSRRNSPERATVSIRDNSRARAAPPSFVSGELCDYCQTCGHERYHCNVCMYVFCNPCWELQFVHRVARSASGMLPHERTDPHVAKKIGNILNSQLKEEQREKLHRDDIDTTWFGVVREGQERPLFQDYGRYASLVADVKNSRIRTVTDLSSPLDFGGETLYPSLVSFVGQTGADKSSLIKLLIDLKSDEDEYFDTPVVGAAGHDIATSEDVHLYMDPDSFESQAPLLFADCEGLEGGERDPIGAKLKRKAAASLDNTPAGRRKPTSERELVWADTPRKQSRNFAVAHLYPRLLYTFSDVIVFVLKNPRYALEPSPLQEQY